MTEAVAHLPTPSTPPARHPFDDPVFVKANALLGRHPQTERTCKNCGAVKVTVHCPDGSGWREWRLSTNGLQCVREAPLCTPVGPS